MLSAVRRHMPALDALRGVAVLLVLAHNFNLVVVTGHLSAGFDAVMNIGWVGVQLFFVLSGFLITGILLDTARANNYYRAFFARRTLRIFPLYYAVLAFGFVVLPLLTKVPPGHGSHQGWQHNHHDKRKNRTREWNPPPRQAFDAVVNHKIWQFAAWCANQL